MPTLSGSREYSCCRQDFPKKFGKTSAPFLRFAEPFFDDGLDWRANVPHAASTIVVIALRRLL
ncbi:hypothetical protein [Phreatobacter sp.]|uniref:hypothetical protein n=1 Tax=Phreatobacter sp. TaxID=1966341 RepID=UPI00260B423D|nr:hypothetical protein [Phreatobacter sp.]